MNAIIPSDADYDAMIDRLIDGELSLEDQRHLFAQLDGELHGWRRLALAFVENQALRQTCQEWAAPVELASPRVETTKASGAKRLAHIVTSAVALLLAFGLGGAVGRQTRPQIVSAVPALPSEIAVETEQDVLQPEQVDAIPVALQYADGTFSQPVNTPVVEATSPLAQPWLNGAYRLPERVREQLRRRGQKLSERQEWVEVDLADGRRGYMPVKEWSVSPVSLADFR